jgi:hypothetical protein
MRCWSINGKSAGSDVRNDVKNDANVAAPNVMPIVIYQTSTKFLKDVAAQKVSRDIVSPASFFRLT